MQFLGYHNLTLQNLLLETGKEVNVTIRLVEMAFEVDAVTVTADKKKSST